MNGRYAAAAEAAAARAGAAGRKIGAVARITLRHQLAYRTDFIVRASFLLLILFVFVQLWSAAYGGDGQLRIAGYTLKQIVWYLVFTEAITMAGPPVGTLIEDEVKNGDIAIRLIRPLSYIGYHYACYMAEAYFRFFIHLAVGAAVAWPLAGTPSFGYGWAALLALSFGAMTLAFLLSAAVALCAFWIEETRGLDFVLQKLKFTVGGMLLPLDMMPGWLQHLCAWLPFQAVLYLPARSAVDVSRAALPEQLVVQLLWIAAIAAVVSFIYRRGVKKLHVNGG
ncbi:ABC transporter permease [Paenibacillus humicola]|uniref:ABC transporter permease n=1 Tax=Paenibacillus humicola TaxID=3110540 RepID=UPI00237BFD66|nr:ABC-2 family transporter protein [Paenibacillus humicola]